MITLVQTYLLVRADLRLELRDACAQPGDHPARLVLVRHYSVLDVFGPIRVVERVQRLRRVRLVRRDARDHQRAAKGVRKG